MEVLVVGAGDAGMEIAAKLIENACGVTLIDKDIEKILQIQNSQKDLRAEQGDATNPDVLNRVDIQSMELVIMLTDSNSTNLAASKICTLLAPGIKVIARVSHEVLLNSKITAPEGFDITHPFNPDLVVSENICNIINNPGCLSIDRFAGGVITMACLRITANTAYIGYSIKKLHETITAFNFSIIAVFRDGAFLDSVDENTSIYAEDEIYIVLKSDNLHQSIDHFVGKQHQNNNIVIAGGTNIAFNVAKSLEKDHNVKIIEPNIDRCSEMAQELDSAMVLKGVPTDEFLLKAEGIEQTDIFCAFTKHDAENLLSTTLARRLGAKRTMVIVYHDAYVEILENNYGVIISPSQITVSTVLEHVRLGVINSVRSLRQGHAEAIELTAKGSKDTSKIVGKRMGDIEWPTGLTLGMIVRDQQPIFIDDDTVIENEDQIICFIANSKQIKKIEKLLAVDFKYF